MARKHHTERDRSERRELILDAAMTLFENNGGLKAVSFRQIATVLDISHSAPYRYFANKDDLVCALRARAFRWTELALLEATKQSDSPEQQLELLAKAYIDNGLSRPHRYALMYFNLDDAGTDERSLELMKAKRQALDVCTRVISNGQSSGVFPDSIDPLSASHLLWTTAHGLVALHIAGQLAMGRDTAVLAPTLIEIMKRGIASYRPHSPTDVRKPVGENHV